MSKNLELKKQVVSDIVKKFQEAQSVIVVRYSGLTVEQVTGLRAQFRANGVEYCVLKNTLVRRALKELNIEGLDEVLNGPSAFAFGMNDPVSPAKIVNDFIVKKKSDAIEIKAGLPRHRADEHGADQGPGRNAQPRSASGPLGRQPAEQHRQLRARAGRDRQEGLRGRSRSLTGFPFPTQANRKPMIEWRLFT